MNYILFFLGFIILAFIVINRILCNENYQHVIHVGYYYHFFCSKIEQQLFIKSMDNIISKIDNNINNKNRFFRKLFLKINNPYKKIPY